MIAFSIVAPLADEDALVTLLWEAGTAGIEARGTAADGRGEWIAFFETDPGGLPDRVRAALPSARAEPAPVPEVDWVARFREGFSGLTAGGFRIVPAWDERAVPGPGRLVVDPGRAFGTGTHETTRLCLSLIERTARRRPLGRVADVGAGTGLLAIAALRLGARAAVALDVDPESTASARAHASLNRVRLGVVQGDGPGALRPGGFDLVLANLSAPLLRLHGPALAARVAPGGALVCSGLLDEDADGVEAAIGLPVDTRLREGGWTGLLFVVPGP